MTNHRDIGKTLRMQIKDLVLDFMQNSADCSKLAKGLTQAEMFRACGLDWGNHKTATSSQQQYWIVGLLRELEQNNLIQRDENTRKWRLK